MYLKRFFMKKSMVVVLFLGFLFGFAPSFAQSVTFYSEANFEGKSVTIEAGKEHLAGFTTEEVKNTDYFLAKSYKVKGARVLVKPFASLVLKEAGSSRPKWKVTKGGMVYSVVFSLNEKDAYELKPSAAEEEVKGLIQVLNAEE